MKRMMATGLVLVLLLSLAVSLQARKPARKLQSRDVSAQVKDKMAVLGWLEGTWTGETMMSRSGQKLADAVALTETVHFEMDGMILVLESIGRQGGDVVQHTWTTITWDARRDSYRMTAVTDEGGLIQPQINADERGMQWQMKMGNARAKYTIEKDGNERKDSSYVAEITGEELEWKPVFSLTLQQQ
ncbi:hypothetical protein KQI52_15065 [bacterium]|nr:hypothetical protein [bacterium]